MDNERATITIAEAARVLGIGRNSAYEAARKGEIPVLRIGGRLVDGQLTGGRLVVPKAALQRLLNGEPVAEPVEV